MSSLVDDASEKTTHPTKSPFKTTLSTVPRVMRSRIVKATKRKPTKPKKVPEAEINNQPIARSNSGKVALGPWVGAFGTVEPTPEDSILYIDRAGSTHLELKTQTPPSSENSNEVVQKSPKGHRKGTVLNPDLTEQDSVSNAEQDKKLRSREIESMQQKAIIANWGRSNCGKQASKGRISNRIGMINQPRKGL